MSAYLWQRGSRFKVDPNIAGQMCEELAETVGLTAETLLNANRPEDAPLHGEFEWDDSIAAEEYRKSQARCIIRCLALVPETEETVPVRAFFNIAASDYEPTEMVLRVPEKKELLLDQALKELRAFRAKYAALVQLAGVIKEVDALLEAV